jgi:hypothetical protein
MRIDAWAVRGAIACMVLVTAPVILVGAPASSANIVGYSKPALGVLNAEGQVVTLADDFPLRRVQSEGIPVTLKLRAEIVFSEVSVSIAGQTIYHPWIKAPDGIVEELVVAGKPFPLSDRALRNGCLSTTQYGNVPILFHFQKPLQTEPGTYVCILVFTSDQLKSLTENIKPSRPVTAATGRKQ